MRLFRKQVTDQGRRRFLRGAGAGTGAVLLASSTVAAATSAVKSDRQRSAEPKSWPWSKSIAADPANVPGPIDRDHAKHHEIELIAREIEGKLDSGSTFVFMTWGGQVPGPMLRVRQDDTVDLTVTNPATNQMLHNVDLHAVYGPGGGSEATYVSPGQSKTIHFTCRYPGAFIYHCAVPNMDEHISRGMFGMIVVEPHQGLPVVDREFYLGQHELYTKQPFGTPGQLDFDFKSMNRVQPNYVLFNGAVNGFTGGRLGRMQAEVGETVRMFMVSGGPNLLSSFHPVGNVWARCWPQGALANAPQHYVQTQPVSPGSCFVGDLELPVPGRISFVDHAMTRVEEKGLLAELEVQGADNPGLFSSVG